MSTILLFTVYYLLRVSVRLYINYQLDPLINIYS